MCYASTTAHHIGGIGQCQQRTLKAVRDRLLEPEKRESTHVRAGAVNHPNVAEGGPGRPAYVVSLRAAMVVNVNVEVDAVMTN